MNETVILSRSKSALDHHHVHLGGGRELLDIVGADGGTDGGNAGEREAHGKECRIARGVKRGHVGAMGSVRGVGDGMREERIKGARMRVEHNEAARG